MTIMVLFIYLVSIINIMYIIRCKGHIKTHDVIVVSIYCSLLMNPFWSYDVICTPTMHGKDDVIFQSCINNWYLVYPHLVGWMSQAYPHLVGRMYV